MVTAIILTVALALLEFRIAQANIGSTWNGYGAIHGAITKTGAAPSRYRVLVPWLLAPVPREHRQSAYLALKVVLIFLSLVAARLVVGDVGLLVLALFMALSFEYDYWDCYTEIIGVCLILSGNLWLVLLGSIVWGLSKETSPLAVPLALFSGGLWAMVVSLVAPVTLLLVMRFQGKAELRHGRWSKRKMRLNAWRRTEQRLPVRLLGIVAFSVVGPYNPGDMKLAATRRDMGPWISLGWTLLAVALAVVVWGTPLAQTYWIGLAWVLAGWTIARVRETRIMLPTAIWMAIALVNHA